MRRLASLALLFSAACSFAAEPDEAIRAQAATLPVLPISQEAGAPKFTVVRLNAPALAVAGARYGAVKFTCPAGKKSDLVWMFADITNVDEYQLIGLKSGRLSSTTLREIYKPTATTDQDDETPKNGSVSSLPRPWDLFDLHMLGVSTEALTPGADYIVWFRFSDRRPTDLLMAATFVEPRPSWAPSDLPSVLALPPQTISP